MSYAGCGQEKGRLENKHQGIFETFTVAIKKERRIRERKKKERMSFSLQFASLNGPFHISFVKTHFSFIPNFEGKH